MIGVMELRNVEDGKLCATVGSEWSGGLETKRCVTVRGEWAPGSGVCTSTSYLLDLGNLITNLSLHFPVLGS